MPDPPPAAAADRPRRSRRSRGRGGRKSRRSKEKRDWLDLPADAISCVFHKLDSKELLLGGVAEVCRSWRRAAREEPELWRHIDLCDVPAGHLENCMRSALRLSAGQCRSFCGHYLDQDHFMLLAKQAPSLESLCLTGCHIFKRGFADGIKELPLLEDLTLNNCYPDQQVLELVAQVCRRLKRFSLLQKNTCHSYIRRGADDHNARAIARMHGLRSLSLEGDDLSNEGLIAIVDGCPNLEYLTIRDCYNITMDGNLSAKCARISMVRYYEYFLPPGPCGCSCCYSPPLYSFSGYGDYESDDYHDLSLCSYLGDEIDCADFEEHEKILDIKSMRRYLS